MKESLWNMKEKKKKNNIKKRNKNKIKERELKRVLDPYSTNISSIYVHVYLPY